MVCGEVPISTYAHVIVVGYYVYQAWVVLKLVYCLASSVGREVIHNHQVKLEVALLVKHRFDGVAYCANTVAHRYHHSCFHLKLTSVKLYVLEVGHFLAVNHLGWCQIAAYLFQMFCAGSLHFYLAATVFGVNIVKDFLAALACVKLHIAIQIFVDVGQLAKLRQFQAMVIQTGKLIVGFHCLGGFLEALAAIKHHGAKVKVIAQCSKLVVNHRSLNSAFLGHVVVVGIAHRRLAVVGNLHKSLDCKRSELQCVVFCVKQHIVGIGFLSNGLDCCRRVQIFHFNHLTAFHRALGFVVGQKVNLIHKVVLFQTLNSFAHLCGVGKRNEAVNSSHDWFKFFYN